MNNGLCLLNKWSLTLVITDCFLPPPLHSLLVKGCDFQHDAPQIDLGKSLKKAVVMGNIITVRL